MFLCYKSEWQHPGTSFVLVTIMCPSVMLALICLLSVSPRTSLPILCVLSGLWRNELGSNMTISAVNAEGGFTGSYHTAVTVTDKRILMSPLKGSQNRKSQRKQPTFGFTVSWTFSNSITVFVGQCFVDDNGEEILKTMWLLRKEVGSPSADWKATRVGTNVFTRIK
uniref:Avidin n=1 Tax=Chrysemys picta bellii TaxID=8478 RepID=A0A8C3IAZ0_CHRPI